MNQNLFNAIRWFFGCYGSNFPLNISKDQDRDPKIFFLVLQLICPIISSYLF
jgi:hypothetical protein